MCRRNFLMRWLLLLAIWLLSCSGCSAADWTVTRTHSHPLAELRSRRQAAPPQVVVVQMPGQTTALRPTVSVESTVPTSPLLLTPTPVSTVPVIPVAAAPVTAGITIPTVPAATVMPRKRIVITIEK